MTNYIVMFLDDLTRVLAAAPEEIMRHSNFHSEYSTAIHRLKMSADDLQRVLRMHQREQQEAENANH